MHERDAILKLWKASDRAVLATVVEVKGSAYRRAGARMLLTQNGHSAGVINGGCLDGDLHARAQLVLESGEPHLAIYDTTSDQDLVFGLGLGCRGVVKILLEPARDLNWLTQNVTVEVVYGGENLGTRVVNENENSETSTRSSTNALNKDSSVSIRSSTKARNGDLDAPTGSSTKALNEDSGIPIGSSTKASNEDSEASTPSSTNALNEDFSVSIRSSTNENSGAARSYVQKLEPPQPLFIFGAGADVAPLQSMGRTLGWNVQVFDLRAPNPTRVTFVDQANYLKPEHLAELGIPGGAACVVMTHNFLHDLELLKRLLPSNAAYIGVLGPRRRTDELLEKLGEDTILPPVSVTSAQLQRVFAPIGLDLGAETPEEIALSILAEIQCVKRQKSGASLRERGRIH